MILINHTDEMSNITLLHWTGETEQRDSARGGILSDEPNNEQKIAQLKVAHRTFLQEPRLLPMLICAKPAAQLTLWLLQESASVSSGDCPSTLAYCCPVMGGET